MYQHRTDLAVEAHEIASKNKKNPVDGVIFREEDINGLKLTRVEVTNKRGEAQTGKPMGKYLSLNIGQPWKDDNSAFKNEIFTLRDMLCELIDEKIDKSAPVMVAGLGNETIAADAIGPRTLSHLIVTRHIRQTDFFGKLGLRNITAICPGVLSQTGIESFEIINSMAKRISPALVIVVDSLASRKLYRLASTVQMSNVGLEPGSGIGNCRMAINSDTMGIPVISLGVPTVVDAASLVCDAIDGYNSITNTSAMPDIPYEDLCNILNRGDMNFYVTPKDADTTIGYLSKMIGYAINLALHSELDYEDMTNLAN